MASWICTMQPLGPPTHPTHPLASANLIIPSSVLPLTTTSPFGSSTFRTFRFCIVTLSAPIRPAMFFPGCTLEPLPCPPPEEPIARCVKELPWEAGWPLQPCFFIPYKPVYQLPVHTFTFSYIIKCRQESHLHPQTPYHDSYSSRPQTVPP